MWCKEMLDNTSIAEIFKYQMAVKTCVKVYDETTVTYTVKCRTVDTNRSRK